MLTNKKNHAAVESRHDNKYIMHRYYVIAPEGLLSIILRRAIGIDDLVPTSDNDQSKA